MEENIPLQKKLSSHYLNQAINLASSTAGEKKGCYSFMCLLTVHNSPNVLFFHKRLT